MPITFPDNQPKQPTVRVRADQPKSDTRRVSEERAARGKRDPKAYRAEANALVSEIVLRLPTKRWEIAAAEVRNGCVHVMFDTMTDPRKSWCMTISLDAYPLHTAAEIMIAVQLVVQERNSRMAQS